MEEIQHPNGPDFKLISQELILDIDTENKLLRGFTKISLELLSKSLTSLNLHTGVLNIHQILLNGKETNHFNIRNGNIEKEVDEILNYLDQNENKGQFMKAALLNKDRSYRNKTLGNLIIDINDRDRISNQYHPIHLNHHYQNFDQTKEIIEEKDENYPHHYHPSTEFLTIEIYFDYLTTDSILSPIQYFNHKINDKIYSYGYALNEIPNVFFPSFHHWYHQIGDWKVTVSIHDTNFHIGESDNNIELVVITSAKLTRQFYDDKTERRIMQFEIKTHMAPSQFGLVFGHFESIVLMTHPIQLQAYCLPGKSNKCQYTVEYVPKILEFYNWILHGQFPFSSYKMVFLDKLEQPHISFTALTLINTHFLIDRHVVDQSYETKILISRLVAYQYFLLRYQPNELGDLWLFCGLSHYIANLFLVRLLGLNEVRLRLKRDMDLVCILDIDQPPVNHSNWNSKEEALTEFNFLKSTLIIHMMESKIGKSFILKVLQSLHRSLLDTETLSSTSQSDLTSPSASMSSLKTGDNFSSMSLHLSTLHFLKLIKKISSKDLKEFAEQWIYQCGYPKFFISYQYNRKRATVEINLRQECHHLNTEEKYFNGSLKFRVVENEGTFDHYVHVEKPEHTFELSVHAKYKRPRRKKDEDDEGMPQAEPPPPPEPDQAASDSPVHWIRVDTEMEWIRVIELQQPDFMWIEQLEVDKDVISQSEAIMALSKFPSDTSIGVMDAVIADWKLYYQIRCMAVVSLASMSTSYPERRQEIMDLLLKIFETKFCIPRVHPSENLIIKGNNFENLPNYFILKTIPEALSKIRDEEGATPLIIVRFLLNLLKFNDNTNNQFSDYAYVAGLINSLTEALIPFSNFGERVTAEERSLIDEAIEELERYRFLDMIEPSHHNAVTATIIQASARLKLVGLLDVSSDIFFKYLAAANFVDVRLAAVEALLLLNHDDPNVFHLLFKMLNDPNEILFVKKIIINSLKKIATISFSWSSLVRNDQLIRDYLGMLLRKCLLSERLSMIESLLFIYRESSHASLNQSPTLIEED